MLVKVVLFAAIVALGWVNRRRLLPALSDAAGDPRRAGVLLRRTLRAELLIGVAALAVTGALAGYAPSIAEGTGPFSADADIGPARLELTVDPARVGPNEVHVYLFDRASAASTTPPRSSPSPPSCRGGSSRSSSSRARRAPATT